jgi:hypothetical protein
MESHAMHLSFWLTQATYTSDQVTPDVLLEFVDAAGETLELQDESSRTGGFLPQWKGTCLSSLGRVADAKPSYDSIAGGPSLPGELFSLLPVYAGLADSSYAAEALETISRPPPFPISPQFFAYLRMLYALSRGDALAARSWADEASVPNEAIDADVLGGVVKAGLGWADLIER